MKLYPLPLICFLAISSFAQNYPLEFGSVNLSDLQVKYEKDTSARAVIIKEFGHAQIGGDKYNLIFKHIVKIKILKKEGLSLADVSIQLYKGKTEQENLLSLRASCYNIIDGKIEETKLSQKNVFTETYEEGSIKKFSLPNVRVGSVIVYEYLVEKPFFELNFEQWNFQNDIPKLESEYWATIPGNYQYNITLRGLLPLTKKESEIVSKCIDLGPRGASDCARFKWAMKNIPAFVEEDYMTSRKNFVAAIHFELKEIQYFDGHRNKVTKEWKDVDQELQVHEKFGVQLRRGKEIGETQIESILLQEKDSLNRAQKIFDFIRGWYKWNENFGCFSEEGIRKAFESKTGNVGDLNLSLVAALRSAGFSANPMILSTRKNGIPTDLFPVISEFNYCVAKLDLNSKVYLLDATDDYLPFGVLPERCLNGKGRVMAKSGSYWYDIKPTDRYRRVTAMMLKLEDDGTLSGEVTNTYLGYKAADVRSEIFSKATAEEFIKDKAREWPEGEITGFSFTNLEDVSKPLVEKLNIKIKAFDFASAESYLLNPFVMGHLTENPFKSVERIYPVDYGAPLDDTYTIAIELPDFLGVEELPSNKGLALPNNGGRFLYNVKHEGKLVTINSSFAISKTVFSAGEYHFLKELYNQVINAYSMDVVLRKKH